MTRYAITGLNKNGERIVSSAIFDTEETAKAWLSNMQANNPPDRVILFGTSQQVRPIPCYDNGDPICTILND